VCFIFEKLFYNDCHNQAASTQFFLRKEVTDMLYLPREEGQGLVEYALILVLVAIVVIVILALLGPALGNIFSNIYTNV
jgi:pilus assembly protein Flp/PilA